MEQVGRELPFVGDDRQELVSRLLRAFDETRYSSTPRFITLEAGIGWGKTRVLHELYRRLAAERQPAAGYWPPSILGAVSEADAVSLATPEGRRKRLYPASFAPQSEGATPHWFWWGISATARRGGRAVQALADDLTQIEAHTTALECRWRELSGRRERLAELLRRDSAREFGRAAGQDALTAATGLAGVSIPALGLLMWAAEITWRQRERWSKHPGTARIDATDEPRADLVDSLAQGIVSFAAAGVPMVVVVEDFHDADPSLVELLIRVLAAGRGSILIVATAWPGALDEVDRPASRLMAEPGPIDLTRMVEGEALTALSSEALAQLVAGLLPVADPRTRLLLTSWFPSPLTLELACSLPRIVELAKRGELTSADLEQLPKDVEGLYAEAWRTLPDDIRTALVLAGLATPAAVSGGIGERTFDAAVVSAAGRLPWMQPDRQALQRLTEGAESNYGWVRPVEPSLRAFVEPSHLRLASDAARDRYTRRQRHDFYRQLATVELDDVPATPRRRRNHALLLVSMAQQGYIEWTSSVYQAVELLTEEATELAEITTNTYVRRHGADREAWTTQLVSEPGDELECQVRFANVGKTKLRDVAVGVNIPPYAAYKEGTTQLRNGAFPDGVAITNDNITRGGIDVGNYHLGAVGYVMIGLQLDPMPAYERLSTYDLRIVGIVRPAGMNEFYNTAAIAVDVAGYR